MGDFLYFVSQSSAIDTRPLCLPLPECLDFKFLLSSVFIELVARKTIKKAAWTIFCLRSNFEQIPNFSVLSVFFTAPSTVDSGFGLSFVFECQNYLHS